MKIMNDARKSLNFRNRTLGLATGLALLLAAEAAFALRCGNRLVTEGMHISEVIARCGEPSYETERVILVEEYVPYTYGGRRIYSRDANGRYVGRAEGPIVRQVVVTELTYNFGPRKLMRRLLFKDGLLDDIKQLGYGYR